jgi:hypothetical protein
MSDERGQNVARGEVGAERASSKCGVRRGYHAGLWALLAVLLVAVNAIRWVEIELSDSRSYTALTIAVATVLPILGLTALYLLDARRAKHDARPRGKTVSDRPKAETSEPEPPEAFRKRLAAYLHVPEGQVLVPRERPVSAMPFWSAVELPRRSTMAKSIEYIRRILLRIWAAVRGDGPGG